MKLWGRYFSLQCLRDWKCSLANQMLSSEPPPKVEACSPALLQGKPSCWKYKYISIQFCFIQFNSLNFFNLAYNLLTSEVSSRLYRVNETMYVTAYSVGSPGTISLFLSCCLEPTLHPMGLIFCKTGFGTPDPTQPIRGRSILKGENNKRFEEQLITVSKFARLRRNYQHAGIPY